MHLCAVKENMFRAFFMLFRDIWISSDLHISHAFRGSSGWALTFMRFTALFTKTTCKLHIHQWLSFLYQPDTNGVKLAWKWLTKLTTRFVSVHRNWRVYDNVWAVSQMYTFQTARVVIHNKYKSANARGTAQHKNTDRLTCAFDFWDFCTTRDSQTRWCVQSRRKAWMSDQLVETSYF